jgi:hypothetical protein
MIDVAHIISELQPWWKSIEAIMVVVGFILAGIGVKNLLKKGHSHSPNYGADLATFVAGVLLVSLPSFLDSLSESIFGTPAPSSLGSPSLSAAVGSQPYGQAVLLVFTVIQLVGLFAVIKGIFLFKDGFDQKDKMGPAWTHMIGGIAALNLYALLGAVGEMLGSNAQGIISKIIGS